MRTRHRSLLLLATATFGTTARAEGKPHASLELGTDFPVSVGARGRLELASHYRLALGIGYLPAAYVDAINGFVVAMGGYDDATATLIKRSLESSLVIAPSLGVRPWSALGLYLEGGYRWVSLGGRATAAELIAGLTGEPVPEARDGRTRSFTAESTLHLASIEVGWEWRFEQRWQLRTALGGVFTLASSSTLEPAYEARAERVLERFTTLGEDELDDLETSYVHAPFVGVSIGYVL